MRFNPPPNWPQPPEGWTPPPGWQPDPSWPQPPWGWPLWVDEDETFISPSHATTAQPARLPWYRRTVTIVLFLIFFFPVGLVLMWMRPDWSVRRRGAVTAVVAVLVVVIGVTSPPPPATTTQLNPATSLNSGSPSASSAGTSRPTTPPAVPSSPSAPHTSAPPKSSAPAVAAPPAPATSTHAALPAPAPTSHAPAPAPPPPSTQAPPPQPSTCGAPSNPYGYNFCGTGGFVSSPPGDICNYFNCINNFWNGHGYMVECNDGAYSMSGGIRGACSYHGGEDRPVYSG